MRKTKKQQLAARSEKQLPAKPPPKALPALDWLQEQAGQGEGTNWKLAFLLMAFVLATDFQQSSTLQRVLNIIQDRVGDEAAQAFLAVINRFRTNFMHEFMG